MIFSHVVAASENNIIGRDGQLPWHLPEDLKRFKRLTMGHCLIMGRKTFDSIGRALPGRKTIVISRKTPQKGGEIEVVGDLQSALDFADKESAQWGEEAFIVGGGEIYRQSMDLVDKIYFTRIHQTIGGDTVYPEVDTSQFEELEKTDFSKPIDFSFMIYRRSKKPR